MEARNQSIHSMSTNLKLWDIIIIIMLGKEIEIVGVINCIKDVGSEMLPAYSFLDLLLMRNGFMQLMKIKTT